MYSHNLTLYTGVNNPVNFVFLNNDQKPVNISNLSVQFNIFDAGTQNLLLAKSASIGNASLGQANVLVTSNDLIGFDPGIYEVAVTVTDQSQNIQSVYVNDNFQSRLPLNLFEGPVAAIRTPILLNFYSNENVNVTSDSVNLTAFAPSVSNYTFYAELNQYTGNLLVQGSLIDDPNFTNSGNSFANVSVINYSNYTGPIISTISGQTKQSQQPIFGNGYAISFSGVDANAFVNAVNFSFIPNFTGLVVNNQIQLTSSTGLPFMLQDGNNAPLANAGIASGNYSNTTVLLGENVSPVFTPISTFNVFVMNPMTFNGTFAYLRFILDGTINNTVIANASVRF